MKSLNLTLRQRKLLHIMQNHHTLITGQELAKQLQVSPRTIRTDVTEINRNIRPFHAEIHSVRSKGYYFTAEDSLLIQQLNQIDNAFLTKEDRVRYLTIRLCLADEPLNAYDLEDEVFVSHTTLEHDIHQLKMQYMLAEPYITLNYSKDFLSFERDEFKIRRLLLLLFHNDWNYQTRGNAYYGYNFLDQENLSYIMKSLPVHLKQYNIVLDDPTLVALNLEIAIMYHRILDGHYLPPQPEIKITDQKAFAVTEDLFLVLEEHFECSFPASERFQIYRQISSSSIVALEDLDSKNPKNFFEPDTIEIAHVYLQEIKKRFSIDFSGDDDFYITLLLFIRDLKIDDRFYNAQKNTDSIHEQLLDEVEIAYLFQDVALRYLGRYITRSELQYLACMLAGALEFLFDTHPERKIRTAVCCHLNPAAYWMLKRQVLGAFDKYLNIVALLPINAQHFYDFSSVDLVLTTVQKNIATNAACDMVRISSPLLPEDYLTLSAYITQKRTEFFYPQSSYTLYELLANAYWHENERFDKPFDIIETLAQDFIRDGIADELQLQALLKKEALISAATRPGILFLYFPDITRETKLSVMTLEHRIKWKSHKIRTIILGSLKKADISLLFRLNHIFHNDRLCRVEEVKMLKTREELCEYFKAI